MAGPHEPNRFKGPPHADEPREEAALPPFVPSPLPEWGAPVVEGVLRRRGSQLMAIDGVQGFGIGRTRTGQDAIVVHLRDAGARRSVPSELDGVPVLTVVTGVAEAL
jgi:hypothetical protein